MKDIRLVINYGTRKLTIIDDRGERILFIHSQNAGGTKIFKAGASHYLALLEIMLSRLYPYRPGESFSFGKDYQFSEKPSRLPKDLNRVLPDYLQIIGTSSFSFSRVINDYKLEISVVAEGKAAEARNTFHAWLPDIDWDLKNAQNSKLLEDVERKGSSEPVQAEKEFGWNRKAISNSVSDYKTESFDAKILPPVGTRGNSLYDYICSTVLPSPNTRTFLIEGDGGAGKTTSIKYAVDRLNGKDSTAVLVYAYELQKKEQTISHYIADHYIDGLESGEITRKEALIRLARENKHDKRLIVFIDGVDELQSKYYRELIGEDINDLLEQCPESLYFIISTRQSQSFVGKSHLNVYPVIARVGRISTELTGLSDNFKELLDNYPQFKTPLFVSMLREMMNLKDGSRSSGVDEYGITEAKQISNKTQLFDAWLELRTSHSSKLGLEPYFYVYVLPLIAYESLKRYMAEGDRFLKREFFDIDNVNELLEVYGGKTCSSIDIGSGTDRLIRILLSTGLLSTNDNENYRFVNMEYMLYLAGVFVSHVFKLTTHDRRMVRINSLIEISEEESNPNLALVSYPEFAFNRIMDSIKKKDCTINDEQRIGLLRLGLAIGYEKVRDVDASVRVLMDWYMKHCNHSVESAALVWRFNATLYSMVTKWKHSPEGAEKHLGYIESVYEWMKKYFSSNKDEYIARGILPFDYESSICGNLGGVEQAYARYYDTALSNNDEEKDMVIVEHIEKALNYHRNAYEQRSKMKVKSEADKEKVRAGLARNIIGMSTDLYLLSLFCEKYSKPERADFLFCSIFGGEILPNISVPGYCAALNLQGKFDPSGNVWTRDNNLILRESEPMVIFRRMAGNCIGIIELMGDRYRGKNLREGCYMFLSYAVDDLVLLCQDNNGYSESWLEFYRPEINDFVKDIGEKFLKMISKYSAESESEFLTDKLEMVIEIYNALHYTNVKIDRRKHTLKNY